ncbi:FAD/NAD(P)-binding domain-containing protein [Aspergillus granulosus]|uniref:FAD/NAD(P)-binding domain-containing protein n=1 Tax=Aspergillus granulosus TaxID=176169 RepID=A0ABR4HP93_9EURO
MIPLPNNSRRLRVTIIGAGVSGILMAIKLQKYLPDHTTFHIYEKSPEIGGTWFENRYPGCACDVPSHLYQYSFALNTEWSRFYATSREIQSYLESVVRQYNLLPHISFNSLVTHAEWSSSRGVWSIEIENHSPIESEILINAGGILNHPQMPEIPGLEDFKGPLLHTAAWDDRVDVSGKKVAIIGAGASAVQLLPEVQKTASHVDVYVRTPSWISPPIALPAGVEKGHIYTDRERKDFRGDAKGYLSMRKGLEDQFNAMFGAFTKGGVEQQDLRGRFEGRMKALIKDEKLQKHLIPSFEAGCRRINPGEEYLVALQEENVRPIFERIERIDPEGVVLASGERNQADVLIAATGFNTSFRPRFPILGNGGVNLQDLWKDDPTSYCGIAVAGFPNYLMFLGPNTPISNGSLMGPLEATSDYITRLIRKTIRQHVRSFDIRADVQADFDRHTQNYMQNMVWTGTCRSWFKNNKTGKVTALWPGSSLHYMQTLAEDRWEDYNWEFEGHRFDYLRGGFSWIEDPTGDVLGREESEAWRMSTVPNKGSDLSFYLVDAVPLAKEGEEKAML